MREAGATYQAIADRLGHNSKTVGAKMRALGITPRVNRPVANWGLPRKTRVTVRTGTLERAVDTLRAHFSPVCAESTIVRPNVIPKAYTKDTLFRVGPNRNVPAADVLAMAKVVG